MSLLLKILGNISIVTACLGLLYCLIKIVQRFLSTRKEDDKETEIIQPITNVVFRYWINNVIALFPDLPGNTLPTTCLSYIQGGQYGICEHPERIITESRPATEEEYHCLYDELTNLGYHLNVRQHMLQRQSYYIRRAAIRASKHSKDKEE